MLIADAPGPLDVQSKKIGHFSFTVLKKKIKHVYFRVYPKKKQVVVSAPFHVDDATLNKLIASKSNWIRQQVIAAENLLLKNAPCYMTPSTIQLFGQPVRIKTITTKGRVTVFQPDSQTLIIRNKKGNGNAWVYNQIVQWLRNTLEQKIADLVEKWEPVLGVTVREHRVRKMKTRWGSCNIAAKRIWLNQDLVHLSFTCLEYVVVHEMVHLLERKHNHQFNRYMDGFFPSWRDVKSQLDQTVKVQ
jgi:predicted metal-dependent hydrolase